MKRITSLAVLAIVVAAGSAGLGQQLKFPPELDKLAAKASEVVDVNMDRRMLDFASRFMDAEDDAEAKAVVKNLRGVYVKSFEFEKPGEYSPADVELFRAQLRGPQWSKMVQARSKRDGDNVEVYFRLDDHGIAQGMAIIDASPLELTLVHIDGPIDPQQLSALGGEFGIPPIDTAKKPAQNVSTGPSARTSQGAKK